MTELMRVPPRAETFGESAPYRGRRPAVSFVPRDLRIRQLPRFRTEQEKRRNRLNVLYLILSVAMLVLILVTR